MTRLTGRLVSGAVRRYFGRRNRTFDLSMVAKLPRRTLLPLQRVGLDPVPRLRQARAKSPIVRLPAPLGLRAWLVTGHAQAKQVLADADTYSTDFRNLAGGAFGAITSPGGLGFSDPPDHTRLRNVLTPEFTMRRLARLAPHIEGIIADRLDAIAGAREPVDLVEEFALPVPSRVICELLGVPYADHDSFQQLAMNRFAVDSDAVQPFVAVEESLTYLLGIVEQQRREPGDGLLGMIIRDHGNEISDQELAGLADGVLTGGFETTASMLALGALVLLQRPEAAARLRHDDAAAKPFVEELLRYLSVVQVAFPRFARRDTQVDGIVVQAGDLVVVSLSGANRDPILGQNVESVDPTRHPVSHVAFGHGIHRCLGAELARMELRAAYPALVRRFPRMSLVDPVSHLVFRPASIVYGLASLRVQLEP